MLPLLKISEINALPRKPVKLLQADKVLFSKADSMSQQVITVF